ncbi:MAG: SUMF1/EgtB/PvdO family nonheme iron enzyme [Anaerolineaceae bacterium]|nr:SUMF1/EgtB/PvdO family nonheme iron enzyme [Anaerolineaceae bacterium]
MPLPHHRVLFISYSHSWGEWSLRLYRAIFDTKLYFPFRDDRIPKTADWWQSLCENIETSVAMVAMLTPEYLSSAFCMGELDYALKLNKPVVPIMLNLPTMQYPRQLNERNIQFVPAEKAWNEGMMRENVLAAMNQVVIDYASGRYPTETTAFLPRPDTLRPPVPVHNSAASPDDRQIQEHLQAPTDHVAKTEQDVTALIKRYYETKRSNPFTAGNLLTQISQRDDLPSFFDVADEREELQPELDREEQRRKQQAEEIRKREEQEERRLKQQKEQAKLAKEYNDLEIVVTHQKPEKARKIVRDWLTRTGYPDKKDYLKKLITPINKLLPQPFAWVEIPVGKVKLVSENGWRMNYIPRGQSHLFDLPAFHIAKYPITNGQFAQFVEAGGYTEHQWWTKAIWERWESKDWTEPKYWNHEDVSGAEYPVVGVSWYEAAAFCKWLSAQTGEKIMLPTEQQWQRAAQGDDDRTYPWGDYWDTSRCNTRESGISRTTPVS